MGILAPNYRLSLHLMIPLKSRIQFHFEPDTFLHSIYRDVLPEGSFLEPPSMRNKNKVKYQCPNCYVAVWGKPGINLICGDCRTELEMLS